MAIDATIAPPDLDLDFELPAAPSAPSAARVKLEPLADHVSRPLYDDTRLLVSELLTNSLKHATSGPLDSFQVCLQLHDAKLRVEVIDGGPGFRHAIPAGEEEMAGRGLRLVDAIADRWGVRLGRKRTCVWFEIDLPEAR